MNQDIIKRPEYILQLIGKLDDGTIKILSGMRGSGKTTILSLFKDFLIDKGINEDRIIYLDFSKFSNQQKDYKEIFESIEAQYHGEKLYLFLDEIIEYKGYENLIKDLKENLDSDIYITCSNFAYTSEEFFKFISEQFSIILVYPLTFKEFLHFKHLKSYERIILERQRKFFMKDIKGKYQDLEILFDEYKKFGSLPEVVSAQNAEQKEELLEKELLSILVYDIGHSDEKMNSTLLLQLLKIIAQNIGEDISINQLRDLVTKVRKANSIRFNKIYNLIRDLISSRLINEINRKDLRKNQLLETKQKYYFTDLGILGFLLDDIPEDKLLENLVVNFLLERNYDLTSGKDGKNIIDFIANKDNRDYYIQVISSESDQFEEKLNILKNETKAYKRIIITDDHKIQKQNINGIEIIDILELFISENPEIIL